MKRRSKGTLVALAGLVLPLAGSATASHDGGHAWLDAPLAGEVVTGTPVAIVGHVGDPTGVAEVDVRVDGELIAQLPGTGETLQLVETEWSPAESGTYVVSVTGRSETGPDGEPAMVVVTVMLDGQPGVTSTTTTSTTTTTTSTAPPTATTVATPTTTPRTTPPTVVPPTTAAPPTTVPATTAPPTTIPPTTTPATTTPATSAPTTTVCELGVPAPTGPTGSPGFTTVTLTWSYAGCRSPERFEIQMSRDAGFARVEHSGSTGGAERSWQTPTLACGTWYWRLRTLEGRTPGPWSSTGTFVISIRGC